MKEVNIWVFVLTLFLGTIGVGVRAVVAHISGLIGPHAPWIATMLLNLVGCFLIGLLYSANQLGNLGSWRLWLVPISVGFLGGLTTFSTFSLDLYRFLTAGAIEMGILYSLASVLGGVGALYLGVLLVERMHS